MAHYYNNPSQSNADPWGDWTIPHGVKFSLIDRDAYGPNQAGSGKYPDIERTFNDQIYEIQTRFLNGDSALIAALAAVPMKDLHPELRPLKYLTDRFAANDPIFELDSDGKKFLSILEHLLGEGGGFVLGRLAGLIGIVFTAYEAYETWKMGENLSLEEWTCLTAAGS